MEFDGSFSKPTEYYENIRQDMLKYVPEGTKTSLEFGCGCGGFSALLKEARNVETWAVELDERAAAEAAKRIDTVIHGDALESLAQIPKGYFDCIILFDVLEHLADPYTLLERLKATLSDGGVLLASIPNVRYYRVFADYVFGGNWDYQTHGVLDSTHLRFFTRKSIAKTLQKLGFEILTLEGLHATSSRTYRLLNILLINQLSDVRYKHFVVVFQPNSEA